MSAIILFMYPGACSRVTMTALEEIGIAYDDRCIDLGGGAQSGADYLAINRKGKVPTLSVDGETLTENAAILFYLSHRYPQAALLPRSDDPLTAARGLSDLIWCASTLHPEVRQIRAPHKWTLTEPAGVHADGLQKFAKECKFISERVGERGWWYGQQWSIVDAYVSWAYSTAAKGGFPLTDYPRLLAYAERLRARPSCQRARARELAAIDREKLAIDAATL